MSRERSRGRTIHSDERNLIARIIKMCDMESKQKELNELITNPTARAAKYCDVSERTIQRISSEAEKSESGVLTTPGKKRKRPPTRNVQVDDFDRRAIKDTVEDFYVRQKVVPTCKKLLPVLREKINFQWQESSLRRILKEMGFRWKHCQSGRKILIERENIVNWRCAYLREIKQLKQENRPIFYLDETWVDGNLTFRKCWQHNDVKGVSTNVNAKNRLIVVHLGGESTGFIVGCELVYRAGMATGDYHGQMNATNFEKWIREKVIPTLAHLHQPCVIVMDNAPYHGKQIDVPPTKRSLKKDMLDYLKRHGVPCDEKNAKGKAALFDRSNPTEEKKNYIDTLLAELGHTVVRLPS